jgi:hypothetical protein
MPASRSQPARRVVALLIETSNAFSRELLHGIRDWMRGHGHLAIQPPARCVGPPHKRLLLRLTDG